MAEHIISAEKMHLTVEAHGQEYNFYFAEEPNLWQILVNDVDGRILSTLSRVVLWARI